MHCFKRLSILLITIFAATFFTSCDNDKEKNLLIVCSDSAEPFAYRDADGELTGFEIELIKAIAHDQKFKVRLVPMEFEEIMRQFDKRVPKFDGAISLITWTTERWDGMEFTHPYFRSAIAAAVKEGVTGVASMEDLKGKKVTCKSGTIIHEYADFLKDSLGFTLTTFEKVDDAFAAVVNGSQDVILEEYPLISYRIDTKKMPITLAFQWMDQFEFSLAVNKGENYNLIRMFNDGLLRLEQDGTYKSILDKYFPNYPFNI